MNLASANTATPIDSLQSDSASNFIELNSVVKKYHTPAGEFAALKGIDLQIARGEFLAILGKSGAGKSTLINLLTGIDHPTSGQVVIDRLAIHSLREDKLAQWRGRKLGIVFQFFQLLPSLTLIENITLSMDFLNSFPMRERKARALHLLDQVGIAEHAYKIPSRISGGQQQRVAIARALANDPPILVADEPTGNLDSKTAHEIFDLFSGLVERGKTLLVVTHDKEIAARATRKIEMIDGEIVANGSVH
jgi:putative ABC transport system ATP-binding protein